MAWIEHRNGTYRVRLRMPDGTVTTDSRHTDRNDALIRAKEIDIEQARDTFLDPRDGNLPLTDWVQQWQTNHQAGPATHAAYDSHLRNHILPHLGHRPLRAIRRRDVKALAKQLSTRLAKRSATDVLMVLSLILREAVEDRRIPFNPAQGVRITGTAAPERPHASTTQITAITERIRRREDQILVLTAAYTGMRWGELAGLQRPNIDLAAATIHVHPEVGALHEVGGTLTLGPPKTRSSVRPVRLPPFLVELLREVLDSHQHDTVFCGARGSYHRRSGFGRRVWRPAVDADPTRNQPAILQGMHFHDLRHTHKTWLIEDGIPEVVQARRLGHQMAGVRGIYSHVTEAMEQATIDALQQRWERTTTPPPTNRPLTIAPPPAA